MTYMARIWCSNLFNGVGYGWDPSHGEPLNKIKSFTEKNEQQIVLLALLLLFPFPLANLMSPPQKSPLRIDT